MALGCVEDEEARTNGEGEGVPHRCLEMLWLPSAFEGVSNFRPGLSPDLLSSSLFLDPCEDPATLANTSSPVTLMLRGQSNIGI